LSKIGRNDPCPCGSGQKYKWCCLRNPVEVPLIEQEPLTIQALIAMTPEQFELNLGYSSQQVAEAEQVVGRLGSRIEAFYRIEDGIVIFVFMAGPHEACGVVISDQGEVMETELQGQPPSMQLAALIGLYHAMTDEKARLFDQFEPYRAVLLARFCVNSGAPSIDLDKVLIQTPFNGNMKKIAQALPRLDPPMGKLNFFARNGDETISDALRPKFEWYHLSSSRQVFFRFTDGTDLSCEQLVHHPYLMLIPAELIPRPGGKPSSLFVQPPLQAVTERLMPYGSDTEKADRFVCKWLELLWTAKRWPFYFIDSERVEAHQMSLFGEEGAVATTQDGLPIQDVIRFETRDIEIHIRPPRISMVLRRFGDPDDAIEMGLGERVVYRVSDRALVYADLIDVAKTAYDSMPQLHEVHRDIGSIELEMPMLAYREVSLQYGVNLNRLERNFRDKRAEVHWFTEKMLGCQRVHFVACIHEDESELSLKVMLDFGDETLISDHLPPNMIVYLEMLGSGLGTGFYADNAELAVKSKAKRSRELKLYKHMGLMLALFHEVERLRSKPELTGSRKQFHSHILKALAPLMATILELPAPKKAWDSPAFKPNAYLKRYVSTRFLRHLETVVHGIYEDFFGPLGLNRMLCLIQGPEYAFLDMRDPCFDLISLVKTCLCMLGPDMFTKVRTRKFEITPGLDYPDPILTGPGLLGASALQLGRSSLLFELNDEPLGLVEPEDIEVQWVVQSDEGWFELNPKVFFKGEPLQGLGDQEIDDAVMLVFQGACYLVRFQEIPSLKWLSYFWSRLQSPNEPASPKRKSKIVKTPRSQFLDILALRAAGMAVVGPPEWREAVKRFDEICARTEIDPKTRSHLASLGIPFHDFQVEGVVWMLNLFQIGLGGVLADDMGLGKTVQTIGLLASLQSRGSLGACLIVVPTSLVFNWVAEFQRFAPQLELMLFEPKTKTEQTGPLKPGTIVLTTYGLMVHHSAFFTDREWDLVFFDEAQSLKNIKSKRTGLARKLPARSKFCLTGTPMENHYGEYFSLIDLVAPGALGSYTSFMSRYRIDRTHQPQPQDVEFLRLKTLPLVLRRIKSHVMAQLPEKVESVVPIAFESEQRKIYRDVAIAWNHAVRDAIRDKGEAKSQIEMLTALLRLRQVCSTPAILPDSSYDLVAPKFRFLAQELETILSEGESAVVFTNFRSTLESCCAYLESEGIETLGLSGQVPRKKRQNILKQFTESVSPKVLMMTLKTGGVGLNLTKASYVFHLEPWWKPQAEHQGTDRVHRQGQMNSVNVYRLIMKNSVEEKMQALKSRKQVAFDALFDASMFEEDETAVKQRGFARRHLTKEDFDYLLELP